MSTLCHLSLCQASQRHAKKLPTGVLQQIAKPIQLDRKIHMLQDDALRNSNPRRSKIQNTLNARRNQRIHDLLGCITRDRDHANFGSSLRNPIGHIPGVSDLQAFQVLSNLPEIVIKRGSNGIVLRSKALMRKESRPQITHSYQNDVPERFLPKNLG